MPISVPGGIAVQKKKIYIPGSSGVVNPILSTPGLVWFGDPSNSASINTGSPVNGDSVALWKDLSGLANNASQTTFTAQLIYTTNAFGSLPGLLAVSTNSTYMQLISDIGNLSEFTLFLLYKPTANATQQFILTRTATATAELFSYQVSVFEVYDGTAPGRYAQYTVPALGFSIGTRYCYQVQSNSMPSSSVLKQNGSADTIAGTSGTSWGTMGFRFIGGCATQPIRFADGYFGVTALYNRTLSNLECGTITTFLKSAGWYL